MNAIWVYISWSADQIDQLLEDAKKSDEIENVQRIMQAIDNGNEMWKSWALSHDGTVVSMSGSEGCIKIGADHLKDLVELRERYSKATKSTISVGVGPKLSESETALQRAQSEGGDRIQLYVEEDNRDDEGVLSKAGKEPALNTPAGGGGMTGPSMAPAAAPAAPAAEASEHSENEALQNLIDTAPPPPEATGPDMDQLKDFLSSSADAQGQKDAADQEAQKGAADKEQGNKDLKAQLLKILKVWKARSEDLEKLSEKDPELYKSMVSMLQTLIAMSKALFGEGEEHKIEEKAQGGQESGSAESKPVEKSELQKGWPTPKEEEGAKIAHDYFQGGGEGGMVEPKAQMQAKAVHPLSVRAELVNKEAAVRSNPNYLSAPPNRNPLTEIPEIGDADMHNGYNRTGAALDNNYRQQQGARSMVPAYEVTSRSGFTVPKSRLASGGDKTWAQKESLRQDKAWWTDTQTRSLLDAARELKGQPPSHFTAGVPGIEMERQVQKPDAYHAGTVSAMRERARARGFPGIKKEEMVEVSVEHLRDDIDEAKEGIKRDQAALRGPKSIRKAALEAGKTGRHNVVLPPGSQKDAAANGARDSGQIKVLDPATGKTKWRSVRAGIVMAPDGTPVSSRNPSGGK